MKEMVLRSTAGTSWHEFRGSITALNTYMDLRESIETKGMFIRHPENQGETVTIARPGIGELWIEKDKTGYQVYLQRGRFGSLLASALGKYE